MSGTYRYPWGEEAFQKARKENKPIFLSGELRRPEAASWRIKILTNRSSIIFYVLLGV